jgi:hypothetical protein
MFFSSLYMQTGSGPMWSRLQPQVDVCKTMWRDIFFISNFFKNGEETCMSWGWYLQVDFQLFLSGLVLLYLYSKQRIAFFISTTLLALGSTAFVFSYTLRNRIVIYADIAELANDGPFFGDVYITFYGRCVPYLVGLTFGVLYMEYRSNSCFMQIS